MSIPRTFISRLQARKASIFTPTLPHGTIKCRNITQTPLTGAASPRPISHAFDPATPPPPPTATPPFTFLHPNNLTTPEYQHTITIIPPNLKVPWPTSLPCALQSRYWREADHAATDYLHTIFSSQPNTQTKEKYIATVSEAAVSYAINLIPLGNPARTKLLTRTFVLAFLHDDAVDKGNTDKNSHLMVPNTSSQSHTTGNEISNHTAFNILRREILAENPTQGEILLRDILSWGCVYQHQKKPITFDSLEEYFLPALEDFGAGLILRTVEFSLNLPSFSSEERGELKVLKDLCARHMLLTNDLYSYAKEVVAEERGGERVFSAVRVVEQVMGVSDTSAKAILRVVIRDLEGRMDEEYVRLQGMEGGLAGLYIAFHKHTIISTYLFKPANQPHPAKPNLQSDVTNN
ncbi:terpenoid synthase [Aspergillus sclerotiicarbonarius CBS 121057]|uniref:Terpenoid synthase n=1 Tax=Aspergillus sclerotiicarbonarius (strain CBS 121057 / IBT 28362) TaxID=1448318 RepID=A0A319ERM0_ASPSB|nr:terpenoid synthase [Aspergillus sclerotiicarbonarius CBS 121057]